MSDHEVIGTIVGFALGAGFWLWVRSLGPGEPGIGPYDTAALAALGGGWAGKEIAARLDKD